MKQTKDEYTITDKHLHCISIMVAYDFRNGSIEDMDWSIEIDDPSHARIVVAELYKGKTSGEYWQLYYSYRETKIKY